MQAEVAQIPTTKPLDHLRSGLDNMLARANKGNDNPIPKMAAIGALGGFVFGALAPALTHDASPVLSNARIAATILGGSAAGLELAILQSGAERSAKYGPACKTLSSIALRATPLLLGATAGSLLGEGVVNFFSPNTAFAAELDSSSQTQTSPPEDIQNLLQKLKLPDLNLSHTAGPYEVSGSLGSYQIPEVKFDTTISGQDLGMEHAGVTLPEAHITLNPQDYRLDKEGYHFELPQFSYELPDIRIPLPGGGEIFLDGPEINLAGFKLDIDQFAISTTGGEAHLGGNLNLGKDGTWGNLDFAQIKIPGVTGEVTASVSLDAAAVKSGGWNIDLPGGLPDFAGGQSDHNITGLFARIEEGKLIMEPGSASSGPSSIAVDSLGVTATNESFEANIGKGQVSAANMEAGFSQAGGTTPEMKTTAAGVQYDMRAYRYGATDIAGTTGPQNLPWGEFSVSGGDTHFNFNLPTPEDFFAAPPVEPAPSVAAPPEITPQVQTGQPDAGQPDQIIMAAEQATPNTDAPRINTETPADMLKQNWTNTAAPAKPQAIGPEMQAEAQAGPDVLPSPPSPRAPDGSEVFQANGLNGEDIYTGKPIAGEIAYNGQTGQIESTLTYDNKSWELPQNFNALMDRVGIKPDAIDNERLALELQRGVEQRLTTAEVPLDQYGDTDSEAYARALLHHGANGTSEWPEAQDPGKIKWALEKLGIIKS